MMRKCYYLNMFTSTNFKDYRLLDAGDKEKLESWHGIILRRPDPMAIWAKSNPKLWERADAIYHRSKSGGGKWEFKKELKEYWKVNYLDLTFKVAPTGFKHTGLFPEQAANWDYITQKISLAKGKISALNLFAYSGAASMVLANAGAEVVHVDASKGMVNWAKENAKLSKLEDKKIRYIVDDCIKFMEREIRRGHHYDVIIMDPPSYGRGPNGELFRFEDAIGKLLDLSFKLLSDRPLFLMVSSYTTGYSKTVLYNVLDQKLKTSTFKGAVISDELGIKIENSPYFLPCGLATRLEFHD